MAAIATAYARLLTLLAIVAGGLLGLMAAAIVADVLIRNLGGQPPAHTLALTEYGLLYITMLAAPWLLRAKGHVHIEILTGAVGPGVRWWLMRTVALICLCICLVVAWYALEVTIAHYQRGTVDVRSFDMPRWPLTAGIALSFALMAIEFGRFFLGFDTIAEADEPPTAA